MIIFSVACGMFLASCGGGSGSSGGKLASNPFLGDLPNLFYQKQVSDSIRDAEEKAAFDKLDWKKKSDWEKGEKLKQKFKAQSEEADKKFAAELEKLKTTLVGKDVPFEMEEGLGYEVTSFKVTEVGSYGSVKTELEIKITNPAEAALLRYANALSVKLQEIDKDGNDIGSYPHDFNINLSGKTEGATGNYTYYSISVNGRDAKQSVNFAKIKFIKD